MNSTEKARKAMQSLKDHDPESHPLGIFASPYVDDFLLAYKKVEDDWVLIVMNTNTGTAAELPLNHTIAQLLGVILTDSLETILKGMEDAEG